VTAARHASAGVAAAVLLLCGAAAACGPRSAGLAARGVPPPQGEAFAASAAPTSAAAAPPLWKPGVRPPPQGTTTRLGGPGGAATTGAGGAAAGPGAGTAGADAAADGSGLGALSLRGGEGARDVGAVRVGGGPGLPDGLLGAGIDRVTFPAPAVDEEDTGIAVNAFYELEWDGVRVRLKVQHRLARDVAARADRYIQRYWIYPSAPLSIADAVAKLPPLRALARLPDDFRATTVLRGKGPGAATVLVVRARTSSPLATAIGYGYAVPLYGASDYYLGYELLLAATPPGPGALVTEIEVDVSTPPPGETPGPWREILGLPPAPPPAP
jgi:hypothetical protein